MVYAQELFTDWGWQSDSSRMALSLETEGYYQSTGFRNEFMNYFIRGGHIPEKTISETIERMDQWERIGAAFRTGFKFYDLRDSVFKNNRWGYSVNFRHTGLINALFTRDFVHGVFVGNTGKEGNQLSLSKSAFNTITYQEIGFSLVDKNNLSEFGVAVIKGQSHRGMNIDNMVLRTNGISSIDLDISGAYRFSDSAANKLSTLNGIGAAMNLKWNMPLTVKGQSAGLLTIEAQNIGVVSWNRNGQEYLLDTNYNYSGFNLGNPLTQDFNTVFDLDNLQDSIVPTAKKKSYTTWLPGLLRIAKNPDPDNAKKWQSIAGLQWRINANYCPLFYAGTYFRPIENWAFSTALTYGGYDDLAIALRGAYHATKISVFLSSSNLIGMMSKNGSGKSLNFGIICRL